MIPKNTVRARLFKLSATGTKDDKVADISGTDISDVFDEAIKGAWGVGAFRFCYLDKDGWQIGAEKFVVEDVLHTPADKPVPVVAAPVPEPTSQVEVEVVNLLPEILEQRKSIEDVKAALDLLQAAREAGGDNEFEKGFELLEEMLAKAFPDDYRMEELAPAPILEDEPVPAVAMVAGEPPLVDDLPQYRKAEGSFIVIGGIPIPRVLQHLKSQMERVDWIETKPHGSQNAVTAAVQRIERKKITGVVILQELFGHNHYGRIAEACKRTRTPFMLAGKGGTGEMKKALAALHDAVFDEKIARSLGA